MKTITAFTLVELMVTIAIAGVVLALGVPYLGTTISNSAARQAAGLLEQDLMYARNSAVTRTATVTVVPTENEYENGWAVLDTDAGDVLRSRSALNKKVDIETEDYTTQTPISFTNTGALTTAGSLTVCTDDGNGDVDRTITLFTSGQIVFTAQYCE